MRLTLLLLMISFFGCTTQQEQNNKAVVSDTIQRRTEEISKFRLTSTTVCYQSNLSHQFDVSIDFKRFTDTINQQDSCSLKVFLKYKTENSKIDSLLITPLPFLGGAFSNCDNMTSYSTNFKDGREIVDNYFGDLVVADLNFDGNDDIAIINDSGGNGGPLYSYYIQGNDRKFVLDFFLTDSVEYFPTKIDKLKQQLFTYVHSGACCVGEHIYQFDKKNNKWKQTSHKILGR